MRSLRSLLAFGVFVLPLCALNITYYIDISPRTENDAYMMNLNDKVRFQATGYQKGENTNISETEIGKLWWDFDKGILAKTASEKNSLTLSALKTGRCKLTVKGTIKNQFYTKAITILVKE